MRTRFTIGLITVLSLVVGTHISLFAQEYDHEVKAEKMSFAWKIDGNDLKIKLSGKTTGWIGIGFNPSEQMKGANFILGYVKNGEAKVTDDYGHDKRLHKADVKMDGSDDVTLVGGSEEGGVTTVEFSIPLDSGDKMDGVLDPAGETLVLLAYGGKRDSFKSKHKYRTSMKVNLTSGKVE